MSNYDPVSSNLLSPGWLLANIHPAGAAAPLRICAVISAQPKAGSETFVLLRECPGSKVYLGALCDAEGRIHEWLEIWVQILELRDLTFSNQQERLANHVFDQRWQAECKLQRENLPASVFITGMETANPCPVLIKHGQSKESPWFANVEFVNWQLCKDDALLASVGLPPYSTSPYRYLYNATSGDTKVLLAAQADAPTTPQVQGIERLQQSPEVRAIFNPHSGWVRAVRLNPLEWEDYVHILEGGAWSGGAAGARRFLPKSIYSELQAWSANPKGIPFLLHSFGKSPESLNEVFFLKLSLLRDMFTEVRAYVKAHQLPLLNLTPASFGIRLQDAADHFPALWTAKCDLVKPGQTHPLKIRSTDQRYFVRLGKLNPSPYLPEGLGAHSFGMGAIRLRNVMSTSDDTTLEGTLVAEDYLRLDAHDLLWFKLPLAEERLEFYAHVHIAENVGPKEARFRTVPARLSEALVDSLKQASGSTFQKAPYEIWPLLSSPCDLYSLGIMAIRLLLANSRSNLPVIVDDVLSLSRCFGKDPTAKDELRSQLEALLENEPKLMELVSPHSLIERDWTPARARTHINLDLWLDTTCLLLRLFPGTGHHSYCQSFGDVSPLALETVFDKPIHELEILLLRLRSLLLPSLSANEEIASVLLQQLQRD